MPSRARRVRGWLWAAVSPRRPALGLFAVIFVPVALASSLAILFSLKVAAGGSSALTLAGVIGVPFLSTSVGLLVAQAWTWVTPAHLYRSQRLAVAAGASYLPYLGGVVAAVWFGLTLLALIPGAPHPLPVGITLGVMGWSVLVWLLVAVLAHRLAELRDREREDGAELAARMRDLEESRRRIVTLQDALRKEAARALHGPIQNRLLLASLRLKSALKGQPAESARLVEGATALIDQVVSQDLRDLMRTLHPAVISLGLPAALRSLLEGFQDTLPVDLEVDRTLEQVDAPGAPGLPEGVRLAAYRIVQETLNNVVKHAQATRAVVSVGLHAEGGVYLVVADNGRGFPVRETREGMGLMTVRDYCGAHGGSIGVESEPGQGTSVTVYLPAPIPEERLPHPLEATAQPPGRLAPSL